MIWQQKGKPEKVSSAIEKLPDGSTARMLFLLEITVSNCYRPKPCTIIELPGNGCISMVDWGERSVKHRNVDDSNSEPKSLLDTLRKLYRLQKQQIHSWS